MPRTSIPNPQLNAAIVGFQRLNDLKLDGLVNPDGPPTRSKGAGEAVGEFPWLRGAFSG